MCKQRNFKLKSTGIVSLARINCICKTYFCFQEIDIVVLDTAVLRIARNFRNAVYAMAQEEDTD